MDRQYVDAFLKDGSIRLSSFATFKLHRDEARGDPTEGFAVNFMNDPENDRHFSAATFSGVNAYVMSATVRTGPEIDAAFGDAYVEIFEPVGFCAAIANEIPGCIGVMISQCIYVDNRLLVTGGKAPKLDELRSEEEPGNISLDKILAQTASISGPKAFFMKTRKYEWQSEYRFIWETNKFVNTPLDIVLPDLTKFCGH
jgi:hypothetical protein